MISLQKIIHKLYADHKWQTRNFSCDCDHNEYCDKCFPPEFRAGGEYADAKAFDGADLESAVAELSELRAKAEVHSELPFKYVYRIINEFGQSVIADDPRRQPIIETIPLYRAPPAQAVSVPEGFRLVPVEPTLGMGWAYLDKANEEDPLANNRFSHAAYRAMLDAAPSPEPPC